MKLKYNLKEIAPRVFHVSVKDSYDLSMLFLRAQEFYESPLKQICGKHFTILEFMELYSKKFGESSFTYPSDWAGFNIPGNIIKKLYFDKEVPDYNHYDETLLTIHDEIENILKKNEPFFDYYLIGTLPKDTSTINHELAHAFFHLNPTYRKEALSIVYKLPDSIQKKIEKHLTKLGYNSKVFRDEMQAYICGDVYDLIDNIRFNKREQKTLKKVHQELFTIALSAKQIDSIKHD